MIHNRLERLNAFEIVIRTHKAFDFPGRISWRALFFSVNQENSIRMAAMSCLTVGGASRR
jgi:hypothetical protein